MLMNKSHISYNFKNIDDKIYFLIRTEFVRESTKCSSINTSHHRYKKLNAKVRRNIGIDFPSDYFRCNMKYTSVNIWESLMHKLNKG